MCMNVGIKDCFWICLLAVVATSCLQSDYEKMLKKEMASGVRNDSLFFGFEFGMTRKDFYAVGWEVNKTGAIMHGPLNRTVQYHMPAQKRGNLGMYMLFFPDFDENETIKNMDLTFRWDAVVPGHPQLNVDTLLVASKDTLMKWYGGNEFILTEFDKEPKEVWVKVDGNRRITLTKFEQIQVKGVISDLTNSEIANSYR